MRRTLAVPRRCFSGPGASAANGSAAEGEGASSLRAGALGPPSVAALAVLVVTSTAVFQQAPPSGPAQLEASLPLAQAPTWVAVRTNGRRRVFPLRYCRIVSIRSSRKKIGSLHSQHCPHLRWADNPKTRRP